MILLNQEISGKLYAVIEKDEHGEVRYLIYEGGISVSYWYPCEGSLVPDCAAGATISHEAFEALVKTQLTYKAV